MIVNANHWEYSFPLAGADYRTDPAMVPPYSLVDSVGVDGRWTGALRRFPGFQRLRRLTSEFGEGPFDSGFSSGFGESVGLHISLGINPFDSGFSSGFGVSLGLTFFKYVEMQKGQTGYKLRGFVYVLDGSIILEYFDTQDLDWNTYIISENAFSATSPPVESEEEIDATFGGRYLYIARSAHRGHTVLWSAGELITLPFGHTGSLELGGAPMATVSSTASASLKIYVPPYPDIVPVGVSVGYRLVDSRRKVASPIKTADCTFLASTVATYAQIHSVQITLTSQDVLNYDTIEIYRTLVDGGVFFLDRTYSVPLEEGIDGGTLKDFVGDGKAAAPIGTDGGDIWLVIGSGSDFSAYTYNILASYNSDRSLSAGTAYDPIADNEGDPPFGGRMYYMGGVNLLATSENQSDREVGDVLWSRTDQYQPQNFPVQNGYRPPRVSDRVERFVAAGDFVFGLSDNRIFRFAKNGTQITIERISHGWGLLNRWAAADMGGDMAMVGSTSLVYVNGSTGSITTVGAVERILNDTREWGGQLDNVFLAYDSHSACLYMVNPDKQEAILVWGTTNVVTRLKDMNFVFAGSGPHPETGGADRAFFVTSGGLIVYPNTDRTSADINQHGTPGTTRGEATGVSGTSVTDSEAAFFVTDEHSTATGLAGQFLYFITGNSAGQRFEIESNTATEIVLTVPPDATAGDLYLISPVPFEVKAWMLAVDSDPRTPRDLFRRRNLTTVLANFELFGDEPVAYSHAQVFDDIYADPLQSKEMAVTEQASETAVNVPVAQPVLYPGVQIIAGDEDFVLRALIVEGVLEDSMET